MSKSEFKKLCRTAIEKGAAYAKDGSAIHRFNGRYGYEYSLRDENGQTVDVASHPSKFNYICD